MNLVGIKRSSLNEEAKRQIKDLPNLTKELLDIIEFIESSKRGICKHRR